MAYAFCQRENRYLITLYFLNFLETPIQLLPFILWSYLSHDIIVRKYLGQETWLFQAKNEGDKQKWMKFLHRARLTLHLRYY